MHNPESDTMKALVFYGPGDLRLEARELPAIGADDVLLKTRYVSICGSDVQPYRSGTGGTPGEIFGHEFVAEIAAVGENVRHYQPGERVFVNNASVCGTCWYCRRGDYNHCPNALKYYTGKHPHTPGALAQYIRFENPNYENAQTTHINSLIPIPENVPNQAAALIEPFGVAIANVEKCGIKAGDTLVVLGAGTIGLGILQWAKHLGATVVAADIVPERLEKAKLCGADYVVDNREGDCYRLVADCIGEVGWVKGSEATTADVVIDCAGYPGSLNDALRIVKAGGQIVELADSDVPSPVNITFITYKHLTIHDGSGCDAIKAVRGLKDGSLKGEILIDGTVDLEHAESAFQRQMNGEAVKILVKMNDTP